MSFATTKGPGPKSVYVSQVVTEHELLQRSTVLEESLAREQFVEFCEGKVQESSSTEEKSMWSFLKVGGGGREGERGGEGRGATCTCTCMQ